MTCPHCDDKLREALTRAVAALEMVTDQNAIKSSTVANAFAECVSAASIGRNALSDQNPIKSGDVLREEIARLTRERDEAMAKVAGAYEAAAELFRDANHGQHAMSAIRALTPADATAALNRVRAGAMREAAGISFNGFQLVSPAAQGHILARADAVEMGE